MRKSPWIASVFFALGLALPAEAQESQADGSHPVVVVVGRGSAEQSPDFGRIRAVVSGEGNTRVEALRALEDLRSGVAEGMVRLDSASVTVDRADDVEIGPVFDAECAQARYEPSLSQGICAPRGYVASMTLHFEARPARMAGPALSLASELGATEVSVEGYDIDDPAALRNAAAGAAMADARSQAELLAGSGGRRLGSLLRIENNGTAPALTVENLLYDLPQVAAGNLRSPAVELSVTPTVVTSEATLRVVFELVP